MQDPSQKLPSFRCFLPVELDDRASRHETRHQKGTWKVLWFMFWRPYWNVAPYQTTVKRWQKWNRIAGSYIFSVPGSFNGNVSSFRCHKQSRETNWFEDYNYIGSNKHGKNAFDKVMKGWKRYVNIEHGVLELKFASSASCCYFAPKFWSDLFQVGRSFLCLIVFMIFGKVNKYAYCRNYKYKEIVCEFFPKLIRSLTFLDNLPSWWLMFTNFVIDILGFWATQWNFHKIQTDYGYSELKNRCLQPPCEEYL